MSGPPSPAEQIRFLQQLQRILADGTFVSTYKYALLHALADLSVSRGDDSGDELPLTTTQLAEQFIRLYWRQAVPFPAPGSAPSVLRQNTGRQAEIIQHLANSARAGAPLAKLRESGAEWTALVRKVEPVVRRMPLWKLQTVGRERLSFLYENVDRGRLVTLRPGVAYCFRAYYDLILDLLRGAWLRFVRAQNPETLGEVTDLSSFLFGSPRAGLSAYQPVLVEVQSDRCFYCGTRLHRARVVDHFVPWARYPTDLGHNFVLAHSGCNRWKSDHLAAVPHLARWLERNERHDATLSEGFRSAAVPYDRGVSEGVTRWAYAHADRIGGSVWLEGRDLVELARGWEALFLRGLGIHSGWDAEEW